MKVYTVECTYIVHFTCNAQPCMHIQHKLHVHCVPIRELTAAVPIYCERAVYTECEPGTGALSDNMDCTCTVFL